MMIWVALEKRRTGPRIISGPASIGSPGKDKVGRLKREIERMKATEEQLTDAEDTQISLTDPDACSMQAKGKATGTVGYNVQ